MSNIKSILVVTSFIVLFSGCAHNLYSEENLAPLGPALTKMSFAVEACLENDNPPAETLSDDALLRQCTTHDPTLLKPFKKYKIRVFRENKRAVLLVCDKDGTRALLEDASCSAKLDKNTWLEKIPQPCEFTLSNNKICIRP